jgi:hypothetical protein
MPAVEIRVREDQLRMAPLTSKMALIRYRMDNRDHDRAGRPRDSRNLASGGEDIIHIHEDIVGHNQIESAVAERQGCCGSNSVTRMPSPPGALRRAAQRPDRTQSPSIRSLSAPARSGPHRSQVHLHIHARQSQQTHPDKPRTHHDAACVPKRSTRVPPATNDPGPFPPGSPNAERQALCLGSLDQFIATSRIATDFSTRQAIRRSP